MLAYQLQLLHYFEFYRDFARSIPRPFALGYGAFTDSVVIMNDASSVICAVQQLRAELDLLQDAIGKLK